MTTHAQQLLSILARLSFRLGQFKLSSGGTSDYYVDCRITTLHAEGGRLTGHAILELLEEHGIEADAVGGLTLGADPIVCNVATASAWRAQSKPGAPLLHGFLVRKAEKAHGTDDIVPDGDGPVDFPESFRSHHFPPRSCPLTAGSLL